MATEAPTPDTYEWTARGAAARINRAEELIEIAHPRSSDDLAAYSIAHSLLAIASMMLYAFKEDYGDE